MSRAAALLTCAGVLLIGAVYSGSRSRRALAPADFTAEGPDAVEFCSDLRPKFIPVANKVSPVVLTVIDDSTVRLATAAGKPIGPKDLVRPPRLFAVNGQATTLNVSIPAPARAYGDWKVKGLPGASKVFADMVPSATGTEMYVEAAVHVAGGADISTDAKNFRGEGEAPPSTRRREASAAPAEFPASSGPGAAARGSRSAGDARSTAGSMLLGRAGPGRPMTDGSEATRTDEEGESAGGWAMATTPPNIFVRDSVQLAVTGPVGARVLEEAIFDLSPGGATGFAVVKAGGAIAFDDPGRYAVWVLGAQGEPVHRFTLFVSP